MELFKVSENLHLNHYCTWAGAFLKHAAAVRFRPDEPRVEEDTPDPQLFTVRQASRGSEKVKYKESKE